jgi:hypothetical protein
MFAMLCANEQANELGSFVVSKPKLSRKESSSSLHSQSTASIPDDLVTSGTTSFASTHDDLPILGSSFTSSHASPGASFILNGCDSASDTETDRCDATCKSEANLDQHASAATPRMRIEKPNTSTRAHVSDAELVSLQQKLAASLCSAKTRSCEPHVDPSVPAEKCQEIGLKQNLLPESKGPAYVVMRCMQRTPLTAPVFKSQGVQPTSVFKRDGIAFIVMQGMQTTCL